MSEMDVLLQGSEWYATAKAAMAEGNMQEAYNTASAAQGPGALLVVAEILLASGETSAAMTTAEQAVMLAAESGSKQLEGAALKMVAKAAFEGGQKDEGMKAAIQAIKVYQASKNKGGEASTLSMVATAALEAGDIKEARKVSDEAANLARKAGDDAVLATTNAAVAKVTMTLMKSKGESESDLLPKALEAAQQAASAYRRMDQKSDLAKILQDLSSLYLFMGNSNMALAKAKECQRIYQVLQNPEGEAKAMVLVAKALSAEGSSDAATSTALDAEQVFRNIGYDQGVSDAKALVTQMSYKQIQEKREFTQRITKKLLESQAKGADDSAEVEKPTFVMASGMPRTTIPWHHTAMLGFMSRSAGGGAPAPAKPGGAAARNKNVIYNVSWNP